MKWGWGLRRDFRMAFDHIYYDGDIYCLNLGWFYVWYRS